LDKDNATKRRLGRALSTKIWLMLAVLLILLHALPFVFPEFVHLFIITLLYALMGQGWNILGGYAGQFSFGHALFFGIGAYTSSLLFVKLGVSPWLGIVAGIGVAVAIGLFIGFLSFRYGLTGPFFALIMLAFAEIFHMVSKSWDQVGAALGILIPLKGNSPSLMQFTEKEPFYFMLLWIVALVTYFTWRFEGTRTGLYWQAIRENQDAASALGVSPMRFKLVAMTFSAGLTAMGGTIYAQYLLYIDPDSTFGVINSVEIMLRPIIGGPGTALGPLLGSMVLTPLSEVTRIALRAYSGAYLMLYGAILVIVVIFLPDGLMGMVKNWVRRFSKRTE
jgi:branched-chain amino acid transport system permease protein